MVPSRIRSSSNHKKLRTNIWPDHGQYLGTRKNTANKHRTSIPTTPTSMSNDQRVIKRNCSENHCKKSVIFVVLEASWCLPHKLPSTSLTVRSDVFSTSPSCFSNKTFHWQGVKNYPVICIYIYVYTHSKKK